MFGARGGALHGERENGRRSRNLPPTITIYSAPFLPTVFNGMSGTGAEPCARRTEGVQRGSFLWIRKCLKTRQLSCVNRQVFENRGFIFSLIGKCLKSGWLSSRWLASVRRQPAGCSHFFDSQVFENKTVNFLNWQVFENRGFIASLVCKCLKTGWLPDFSGSCSKKRSCRPTDPIITVLSDIDPAYRQPGKLPACGFVVESLCDEGERFGNGLTV